MTPFVLSFNANSINAAIHKHSAYQIVFSHDKAFHSTIDGTDQQHILGFLVRPHLQHACRENNSLLTIMNVEPYSPEGKYLHTLLFPDRSQVVFRSKDEIVNLFQLGAVDPNAEAISYLLANRAIPDEMDDRISTVIHFIDCHYWQKLTPDLLSKKVFLSPSRLSALFKQQTGSSLSKYILWTRMRHAVRRSLRDKQMTLTDIAFETGFYDLSQMDKYMYEMLGVSPKILRQNSDLIQISVPEHG